MAHFINVAKLLQTPTGSRSRLVEQRAVQNAADSTQNASLPVTNSMQQMAVQDPQTKEPKFQIVYSMAVGVLRVCFLLTMGYASRMAMQKYERTQNYRLWRDTLLKKISAIASVSGLVLSSTWTMLASGMLSDGTYVATMATNCLCFISIISALLCLGPLNATGPRRLMVFNKHHSRLFVYLFATPSLFGGMSAIAFFVAVTMYSFQAQCIEQYGRAGQIVSIVCCVALAVNSGVCLFLGGTRSASLA